MFSFTNIRMKLYSHTILPKITFFFSFCLISCMSTQSAILYRNTVPITLRHSCFSFWELFRAQIIQFTELRLENNILPARVYLVSLNNSPIYVLYILTLSIVTLLICCFHIPLQLYKKRTLEEFHVPANNIFNIFCTPTPLVIKILSNFLISTSFFVQYMLSRT